MPFDPSRELEEEPKMGLMTRRKSASPDDPYLPSVLFQLDGGALTIALICLARGIWNEKHVLLWLGESLIVPVFKKGARSDHNNDHEISLIPIVTTVLNSTMLRRSAPVRATNVRERQGGFRPGQGRMHQIFTLRQFF